MRKAALVAVLMLGGVQAAVAGPPSLRQMQIIETPWFWDQMAPTTDDAGAFEVKCRAVAVVAPPKMRLTPNDCPALARMAEVKKQALAIGVGSPYRAEARRLHGEPSEAAVIMLLLALGIVVGI